MVKYSPINQFIKGFSPSMAVNSYLNDNVEGKQFYFSFGSFSTWGTCFTFSTLELQNSAGAKAFCNLTSNERSLEMGQVIKMSLKPNDRCDLNS